MSRQFKPTAQHRELARALLVYGIPLANICRHIINAETRKPISYPTFVKVFAAEIATAVDTGNAKVAENLYRIATKKADTAQTVAAAVFWMRTRGGWKVADTATPPPREEPLPETIGSAQAAQAFIDEALARYGRRRRA